MKTASWIIVRRDDGKAVLETFSNRVASAINLERYEVLPALEYLGRFNRAIQNPIKT